MEKSSILFWNVDTQIDFVEPTGKLYVEGAERLKPIWRSITDLARRNNIRVVNTADFHTPNTAEISKDPDFVNTFPEHCMANTAGAEFVAETKPQDPFIVDWNKKFLVSDLALPSGNVVIRKDVFDVFKGNPYTDEILKMLAPKVVFVYGVTTNVCVNDAVLGLEQRVGKVYVVRDAIKELPNIPLPFDNWKSLGVDLITFNELKEMLEKV
jgi:nicotinamidase/pyrazinamidase